MFSFPPPFSSTHMPTTQQTFAFQRSWNFYFPIHYCYNLYSYWIFHVEITNFFIQLNRNRKTRHLSTALFIINWKFLNNHVFHFKHEKLFHYPTDSHTCIILEINQKLSSCTRTQLDILLQQNFKKINQEWVLDMDLCLT